MITPIYGVIKTKDINGCETDKLTSGFILSPPTVLLTSLLLVDTCMPFCLPHLCVHFDLRLCFYCFLFILFWSFCTSLKQAMLTGFAALLGRGQQWGGVPFLRLGCE